MTAEIPPQAAAGKPVRKATKAVKPRKTPRPAAPETSKSGEVRKLAAAAKAKGEKPRPSVIVATMAKQGIDIAPAHVSIVLKKMGFRPLRTRRGTGGRKRGAVASGASKPGAGKDSTAVSIEDLLAAKKAVAGLGGADRALEAIRALKRLEG